VVEGEAPQLGPVEVGGLDLRVGISNPPYEMIAEVCEKHSAAFLRVASLVPRVVVEVVKREKLGNGLARVEIRVANTGYLSTYGVSSAKKLAFSEPLRATVDTVGATLAAPTREGDRARSPCRLGPGPIQRRGHLLPMHARQRARAFLHAGGRGEGQSSRCAWEARVSDSARSRSPYNR
jgi:hypothetical protein